MPEFLRATSQKSGLSLSGKRSLLALPIKENTKFESDIFKLATSNVIANKMKREAEMDRKKYFPGKEIVLLKTNFKMEGFLKGLSLEQYSSELKEYLDEIKLFFES